jgi:hypothetical protein
MKAPVNVFALLCTVITVELALLAAPASAQEEAPAPDAQEEPAPVEQPSERSKQLGADRWVPSLAVVSGITYQKWDADASSTCTGCTNPANEPLARPSASGDDNAVTPFVGGQLELMTPELPLPLSPRLFVGGGMVAAFGTDRQVANEGNPGPIDLPLLTDDDASVVIESAMLGQGSRTSAEIVDDWIYEAHAGLAFPLEFLGRQFRLKPSAGWIHYEVDAKGRVSDAECVQRAANTPTVTNCNAVTPPPPFLPGYFPGLTRAIELTGDDSGSFHGIGGGLDLEMDVFHIGPFGSALFIGAHAYKILGEREIEFSGSASFPVSEGFGLGPAEYASNYRVEVDPWFYRMGLGFRMQWVGFDAGD